MIWRGWVLWLVWRRGKYVHPHTQLKMSEISHTHTQSKQGHVQTKPIGAGLFAITTPFLFLTIVKRISWDSKTSC